MSEKTILIMGAGNMGCSLAIGLVNNDWTSSQIMFCELNNSKHVILAEQFSESMIVNTPQQLAVKPDIVILAVKPHDLPEICNDLVESGLGLDTLFISIAAGAPISALKKLLGEDTEIVRCMPNTPAGIGLGMTGLYTSDKTSLENQALAETILQAVGKTIWVDEEIKLDAITALSGSGPAYLFYLMESLQEAGQTLGLNKDDCYQLALQTMLGAAQLASESNESFEALRANVTSKGGTTEHALDVFEKNNFKEIIVNALQAASNRAAEISKSFAK
ncbi:MAG: pyrroline-5-carboxylate reductase [Pseudomonadota bacterium]